MIKIPKYLYSQLYYTSVISLYFNAIQPTEYYLKEHAKDVPWHKAVEIILTTKNPRKKDNKFEIEKDNYSVVFEIQNKILYIINAKKIK